MTSALSQLTAANQLTILRMLLIPAFVILLLYGYRGWALVTFITAGITDLLDGLIARWSGQKTTLGAWLDPMADKLLLVTMFVMLTLPDIGSANRLPIWFTVLVISRDVAIVATVAVVNLAVGPRTFPPSMFGKIATATYVVTGVVALYFNYLEQPSPVVTAFIYASLAITLVSAFHYLVLMFRTAAPGAPPPHRSIGSSVHRLICHRLSWLRA
jgi:cardiolipin synthase (CMP-forming)